MPSSPSRTEHREPTRAALVAAMLGGLVLHGLALAQAWRENPLARHLIADSEVYWRMAGEIAGGDLVREQPFFVAPLYPYLLGLVRALGGGLRAVYALQLALHLATAVLLARAGTRRFCGGVGLGAAATWLVLADPAYSVGRVLAGSLQAFLVALLLERSDALARAPSGPLAVGVGIVAGALALAWPPAVALVPLVALAVLIQGAWRGDARRRAALAAAAALATLAPATLHNRLACGEWIPLTAHGGLTFYHGNNPAADGTYSALDVASDKRAQDLDALRRTRAARGADAGWRDVSPYFLERGLAWWRAEPGRAAALAARKAWWTLAGRVYGDLYLPFFEARETFGSRLRWFFVPVAWCTWPALVLAALLVRRPRENLVALALAGLPLAVCTVFWYTPRYRLPATPLVVLFAVAALARAWEQRAVGWRARTWRAALALSVALGLTSGLLSRAAGIDRPERYRGPYELRLGDVLREAGELDAARRRYEAALEAGTGEAALRLADLSRAEDPAGALRSLERYAAEHPSDLYAQRTLAVALAEAGELDRARAAFEAALRVDPDDGESHAGLANVLLQQDGPARDAAEHLRRALERLGEAPDLSFNLGVAWTRCGEHERAVEAFRATLALDPDHERAASLLVGELQALGREGEALEVLRAALARRPGQAEIRLVLAWALATSPAEELRSGEEAFELASAARATLGERWDVLDTLAAAEAARGRFGAALELARAALALLPEGDPSRADVASRASLYETGAAYREPR